jgi:hypothetical protein
MTLHEARCRIQIEFIEMPGLKLTPAQIARLCGVPRDLCEAAVSLLVAAGILTAAPDGSFLCGGPAPQTARAARSLAAAS